MPDQKKWAENVASTFRLDIAAFSWRPNNHKQRRMRGHKMTPHEQTPPTRINNTTMSIPNTYTSHMAQHSSKKSLIRSTIKRRRTGNVCRCHRGHAMSNERRKHKATSQVAHVFRPPTKKLNMFSSRRQQITKTQSKGRNSNVSVERCLVKYTSQCNGWACSRSLPAVGLHFRWLFEALSVFFIRIGHCWWRDFIYVPCSVSRMINRRAKICASPIRQTAVKSLSIDKCRVYFCTKGEIDFCDKWFSHRQKNYSRVE